MVIQKKREMHVRGGNTLLTSPYIFFQFIYISLICCITSKEKLSLPFFFLISDTEVLTWPTSKDCRNLSINVLKRDIAAMKVPIKNSHYHTKSVRVALKSQIYFKLCCFWNTLFLSFTNLFKKAFSAAIKPNKTEVCTAALFFWLWLRGRHGVGPCGINMECFLAWVSRKKTTHISCIWVWPHLKYRIRSMPAAMNKLSHNLAEQIFRLVNRGLEIFLLGNSREEMTT